MEPKLLALASFFSPFFFFPNLDLVAPFPSLTLSSSFPFSLSQKEFFKDENLHHREIEMFQKNRAESSNIVINQNAHL